MYDSQNQLMRLPEVMRIVGVGKTKIYAMIKDDDFPKPVKLGKASRWPSRKVSEWIEKQASL